MALRTSGAHVTEHNEHARKNDGNERDERERDGPVHVSSVFRELVIIEILFTVCHTCTIERPPGAVAAQLGGGTGVAPHSKLLPWMPCA
jgi:hypothetical protein